MSSRVSRQRRPSTPLDAQGQAWIAEQVAKAPPMTASQVETLQRIMRASQSRLRELAAHGRCRWNGCGSVANAWTIEEVDGAVPVCNDCVAEHSLVITPSPVW